MKTFRWWLFLGGLLWFTTVSAQVYDAIIIDNQKEWKPAGHVYYLSSPDLLTPGQIFSRIESTQAAVINQNQFKMGFSPEYFWFYFKLKNTDKAKTVMLSLDRPDLHHVQCFRRYGGRIDTLAITGDAVPFTSRPVLVNGYAIPILLDTDQEVEILLLVDKRNEFIASKLSLYELNRFYEIKRYEFGVFSGFLGLVVFQVLFQFFLWLSFKDTVHLYFTGQLLSICFYLAGSAGFLNEWSLLDLPYRMSSVVTMLLFFWAGFNFFFINSFLKLNRTKSLFYRLNYALGYVNIFLALGWFLGIVFKEYPLTPGYIRAHIIIIEVVYAIDLLILVSTLVEQSIKKNPMAILYGVAASFIFLGFALAIFERRHPSFQIHQYLSLFGRNLGWIVPGVFLEQVILAFGLTIRYNQLNQKNMDLKISLSKVESEVAEKVIHAQETEHKRLAKDLHDGLGGTLSIIKGKAANENASRETLCLIEKAIDDLRNVSRNLMPPELEKVGLAGAVHQGVGRLQNISETRFIFISFGREMRLGAETELNIYRIVGELLNNILKHAKASEGVVQLLYYEDHLLVSVEDNGIGIKTEEKNWGIGLKNINSRVEYLKAELSIDTGLYGTTVMIKVPY